MPEALIRSYRRPIFNTLRKYLKLNRVLVIKGPRRVGKTVLIHQIINYFLNEKTPPANIIYLSFDDPKIRDLDFDEIIDFYESKILKSSLEKEKTFFFLDEVQYLENWSLLIKKYFDRGWPIKFVVSGSSAALIKKGAESLAGRTIEQIILPFSFREFFEYSTSGEIQPKNIKSIDLLEAKGYEKKAKLLFEIYLRRGGFPNLFEIKDEVLWPKVIKEDIIEKVIYRDLAALRHIKKPEILEKLLLYCAAANGQILNVQNISRSLGLSREYVARYLLYLKQSYLLFTVKKFAPSLEKIIRSNEKVYLFDSGLANALLSKREISKDYLGHLIEGLVASRLFGQEYYYWKNYYEVDYVLKSKNKIIPLEVKYQRKIDKEDLKGLFDFLEKFNLERGIVISENLWKKERIKGKEIEFIPAWLFLLFYQEDNI